MALALINNGDSGATVRATLNQMITLTGTNYTFTSGSIVFVDPSGNYAQDNSSLAWDDTNNALKLGGSNAVFKVASGGGDNWFLGGAGNFTLSGSGGAGNIGIGQIALQSLTSGSFNFALGSFTLQDLETGDNNVGIGTQCMSLNVAGSRNVAIGRASLDEQFNSDAIGIGDNALGNYDGLASIGIGTNAAFNMTTGTKNIFIGYQCGSATSGPVDRNVWLGGYSGFTGTLSDTIVFANGDGTKMPANFNLTTSNVWSFANYTTAVGLHIYNTSDHVRGIGLTDWERAIVDWRTTSNVFRIGTQAGGAGVVRLTAIDGFAKAGAPAASDLPAGSFALIDDTSADQTWLVFNKAGTIRKVQLV